MLLDDMVEVFHDDDPGWLDKANAAFHQRGKHVAIVRSGTQRGCELTKSSLSTIMNPPGKAKKMETKKKNTKKKRTVPLGDNGASKDEDDGHLSEDDRWAWSWQCECTASAPSRLADHRQLRFCVLKHESKD